MVKTTGHYLCIYKVQINQILKCFYVDLEVKGILKPSEDFKGIYDMYTHLYTKLLAAKLVNESILGQFHENQLFLYAK